MLLAFIIARQRTKSASLVVPTTLSVLVNVIELKVNAPMVRIPFHDK